MARKEKRIELRTVDEDAVEIKTPVFRLKNDATEAREIFARLGATSDVSSERHRLEIPNPEDFEIRTHQPGIEAIVEVAVPVPEVLEEAWGTQATDPKRIAWGWFALVGSIIAAAIIWSLNQVKTADAKAEKLRTTTESVIGSDAQADQEAGNLIDRIDATTKAFFEASTITDLARYVRQPERVRPLMERYYAAAPLSANPRLNTKLLQPITIANRANLWVTAVELDDHKSHNLIIEIFPNGEPRIDWETFVCYQPMKWDTFATQRPTGTSYDFRLYVEPDNFFSHEFTDSKRWFCFRLTALDSDETLFGYAPIGGEICEQIAALLNQNHGRKTSVILRLSIPVGLQSRTGVIIEKLVSPRWIYLDPPE